MSFLTSVLQLSVTVQFGAGGVVTGGALVVAGGVLDADGPGDAGVDVPVGGVGWPAVQAVSVNAAILRPTKTVMTFLLMLFTSRDRMWITHIVAYKNYLSVSWRTWR